MQNLEAELSEDFSHLDISYAFFLSTFAAFLESPLIDDDDAFAGWMTLKYLQRMT